MVSYVSSAPPHLPGKSLQAEILHVNEFLNSELESVPLLFVADSSMLNVGLLLALAARSRSCSRLQQW